MQVESISRGRKILLTFVRDLASKRPKYNQQITRALKDVHPRTEYCTAMLIRDLADVCVTLNRLEHGRRRSDEAKQTDAGILFEALKEEFSLPSLVEK